MMFDSHGCRCRGQFEMIGLVFVVLIIVVGLFLYFTLGSKSGNAAAAKSTLHDEAMRSYLLTLAQTDVTACGTNVYAVARACSQKESVGRCADPCSKLQDAMDNIVESTLKMQGLSYNLTLEGTSVTAASQGCNGKTSETYATPELPIPVAGGTKKLSLALCR